MKTKDFTLVWSRWKRQFDRGDHGHEVHGHEVQDVSSGNGLVNVKHKVPSAKESAVWRPRSGVSFGGLEWPREILPFLAFLSVDCEAVSLCPSVVGCGVCSRWWRCQVSLLFLQFLWSCSSPTTLMCLLTFAFSQAVLLILYFTLTHFICIDVTRNVD